MNIKIKHYTWLVHINIDIEYQRPHLEKQGAVGVEFRVSTLLCHIHFADAPHVLAGCYGSTQLAVCQGGPTLQGPIRRLPHVYPAPTHSGHESSPRVCVWCSVCVCVHVCVCVCVGVCLSGRNIEGHTHTHTHTERERERERERDGKHRQERQPSISYTAEGYLCKPGRQYLRLPKNLNWHRTLSGKTTVQAKTI